MNRDSSTKLKTSWLSRGFFVNCNGGFSAIDEEVEAFSEVQWEDAEPRELILK